MKSSSVVGLLLTASMGVGHHPNAASTRRTLPVRHRPAIANTRAIRMESAASIPTDALICRGCGSVEAPRRWSVRRPSKVASS